MSGFGFTSAGTSYDDEDRLTGFARASGTFTQSWNLTSVGDWNSVTTNGTAQNRTHGPTHELLTAGGQNVTTDVKGNITLLPTTLTTSGVAMSVGYDFDNKLNSGDVDNNGSSDVTFQYDALGRRVARLGTGGSLVFVQHDQQTIADYGYTDAPSSPLYRYVYASYIDEPVVRKGAGTGGTIHYYHRNQQYSIIAVTTSTGAVAERYAYTAYGQPTILDASGTPLTTQTSTLNARYLYTGREWDATLGLYHFRARWMSGVAGRFMGRDPIGYIDGRDLYANYMSTSNTDPTGKKCCLLFWAPGLDPGTSGSGSGHVALKCGPNPQGWPNRELHDYYSFYPDGWHYESDDRNSRPPDRVNCLDCDLDEMAIRRKWNELKDRPFHSIGQNCSTTAVNLIESGLRSSCPPLVCNCGESYKCLNKCADSSGGPRGIDRPVTAYNYVNCLKRIECNPFKAYCDKPFPNSPDTGGTVF